MMYDWSAKSFISCKVLADDPEHKHYHAGLHGNLLFHTRQYLDHLQVFDLHLWFGVIKAAVRFNRFLTAKLCVQCRDWFWWVLDWCLAWTAKSMLSVTNLSKKNFQHFIKTTYLAQCKYKTNVVALSRDKGVKTRTTLFLLFMYGSSNWIHYKKISISLIIRKFNDTLKEKNRPK